MTREDELLNQRIAYALKGFGDSISSKRMFGGSCFLYKGKMCVGVTKGRLMVRILSEKIATYLELPYVHPMDFTGKPLKEFVFVSKEGYSDDAALQQWVELGIEHAKTKVN